MKETKEKLNKWKGMPCSWIKRLNIVKILVLPNFIYRFNSLRIKTPASYFVDINTLILKFIWREKRPRIVNMIWKRNKVEGLILLDFKTYYITTVNKTVWYWQKKNKQIDKWNRTGSAEMDPHKYCQVIFDQGAKAISLIIGAGTHPHAKIK